MESIQTLTPPPPKHTPLHDWHVEAGATMAPFAGYDMPIHYPAGILTEHRHTRAHAGLFDVSHMGQALLHADNIRALMERLVPADLQNLAPGAIRYTLLTNDTGGIRDDLMITRPPAGEDIYEQALWIVVNASRKDDDLAHLAAALAGGAVIEPASDWALIALQGPDAATVLRRHFPKDAAIADMPFMSAIRGAWEQNPCLISRCGYTGEDGFEIAVPNGIAESLTRALADDSRVAPAGLGARDSLRLEAGLCLHGNDISDDTSPVSAGLAWTIPANRRASGGFPGARQILAQLRDGPPQCRIGILPEGRAIARRGDAILNEKGDSIGGVTSGGFSPTLERPVAMGYVEPGYDSPGTSIMLTIRGKRINAAVSALPFVPHQFHRGNSGRTQ